MGLFWIAGRSAWGVLGLPGASGVVGVDTGRLFGGELAATGEVGMLGEVTTGELAEVGGV